jgi:hypothetical protein
MNSIMPERVQYQQSCLHKACKAGQVEVVRYLCTLSWPSAKDDVLKMLTDGVSD